jgi:hypothetical protein
VGVLLVGCIVLILAIVPLTIAMELWSVRQWFSNLKYSIAKAQAEPTFDPSLQEHIVAVEDIKLGKVLGKGAEGVVRAGKYAGKDIAVKIVNITSINIQEAKILLDLAQLEAQTLHPLHHPNVVSFYGIAVSADVDSSIGG